MKSVIKHYLKNSKFVFAIVVGVIFLYLKFSYFTSKWYFILPEEPEDRNLDKKKGLMFAIWHNRLAYSMQIMERYKPVTGLASPHSDGKIIRKICMMMGYKIIDGSTNKNSNSAVREIIKTLNKGARILITPDGPRGPAYKNGSIITKIAAKYDAKLIPISCHASKYFELKTWDKMMVPKPFSKILVIIEKPLALTGDKATDQVLLEAKLNALTDRARQLLSDIK